MKHSIDLVTRTSSTAHRRIVDDLRSQILTGKFAPGTQLPSTKELAAVWGSSPSTIHIALKALTKEGWLDRRHGSGTFIADPKRRFLCAGIYLGTDIRYQRVTAFLRNLHFALLDQLKELGKTVRVFIDSRPEHEQHTLLPDLTDAIATRNIQCLIAPATNPFNGPPLAQLTLPTAFISNSRSPHRANFDIQQFFHEGVRHLAEQGCKSVGLISNVWRTEENRTTFGMHYDYFRQAAAAAGLATKDQWTREPAKFVSDREIHGFREFKSLWRLGERPEGLIVYPDEVACGVILAVLELDAHVGPAPMKFVFHRNAHLKVLCPFPVTWAISDEDTLAGGLIRLIEKQFQGEKHSPILIPYVFQHEPGDS